MGYNSEIWHGVKEKNVSNSPWSLVLGSWSKLMRDSLTADYSDGHGCFSGSAGDFNH
jgi:hypothetical protein